MTTTKDPAVIILRATFARRLMDTDPEQFPTLRSTTKLVNALTDLFVPDTPYVYSGNRWQFLPGLYRLAGREDSGG